MGEHTSDDVLNEAAEEFTLAVDDRGRVTLPRDVRDSLGIEPNDTVTARVQGTVLTVDPRPSDRLETASADREDWSGSTPMDAGESLFGPAPFELEEE